MKLNELPRVEITGIGQNDCIFSITDIEVLKNMEIERERKDRSKYKKTVDIVKVFVETFPEGDNKYFLMNNDGLTYQRFMNFIETNGITDETLYTTLISSQYKNFDGRTFEIYDKPKTE